MKTKTKNPRIKLLASLLRIEEKNSRLLVASGADPWIILHEGWYYYCRVVDDWQITVSKAKRLEDITNRPQIVWQSSLPSPAAEIWAPELHFVRGRWYIYFTTGKSHQHRMYVLEAKTTDPQGAYELKGQITDPTNKWAIDGTIMDLRGQLYFIWSGWEGDTDVQQNLYIAPMNNPWTISGDRVRISSPELAWESATAPGLCSVNEGPEVLYHNGKTFIIYSASHSLTNDYCLGMLTLVGEDPLRIDSWHKNAQPVFSKTEASFGPGHASFTKMPDGSDWIIYHTARFKDSGWDRQVRAQKFTWNSDDSPNFGSPLPIKQKPFFIRNRPIKAVPTL